MTPHLKELPPLPPDESPLRRLMRPLLGLLVALGIAGGAVWLYTGGIEKLAVEEVNVTSGLRAVARDLWMEGNAPEIREMNPDLITELARLRKRVSSGLQVVVLPAENTPGTPRATHEIIYLAGERQILGIRVFFDEAETKIDILSFATSPEFADPAFPLSR